MDLSIGLDGYVFLGITPVGQDASSSTATGPNGPEEGGRVTTLASFDQSWIYVRGYPFRVSQILNHFRRVGSRDIMSAQTQLVISPNA